jgi:hypothetical protein
MSGRKPVGERPAGRLAGQHTLGMQAGERRHHGGVREVAVEPGLDLGGRQRPAGRGEAAEHFLFQGTACPS